MQNANLPLRQRLIALAAPMATTTLAQLRAPGFEALMVHLRAPATVPAVKAFLVGILDACAIWHPAPGPDATMPTRLFLATYMIALYPNHVFEAMMENLPLITAAEVVTERIDLIISILLGPVDDFEETRLIELTADLRELLLEFRRQFIEWKVVDEVHLVRRVATALRSLRGRARDPATTAEAQAELLAQIDVLRGQIAGLGPDGVAALHAFDNSH